MTEASRHAPKGVRLVIAGPAGAGKSTLLAVLKALGWIGLEADDFHAPAAVELMKDGETPNDEYRLEWIGWIAAAMRRKADEEGDDCNIVATCTALKFDFRERWRHLVPGVRIVFLDISEEDAHHRVSARADHWFGPHAVAAQHAAIDVPRENEPLTVRVDAMSSREEVLRQILDLVLST